MPGARALTNPAETGLVTVGYGKDQLKNKHEPFAAENGRVQSANLGANNTADGRSTAVRNVHKPGPGEAARQRTSQDRERLPWARARGLGHGRR